MRMVILAFVIFCFAGAALAESVKTSKERLSDKASDEQRLDNCHVPPARRGPVARPDCQPATATVAPASTGQTSPGHAAR